MYLKHRTTEKLVEVLSINDLYNPLHTELVGRYHYGEEVQEAERFAKADLIFLSGENLPRCWTDVHYRDAEAQHHYRG
jgi:hypothetical protein